MPRRRKILMTMGLALGLAAAGSAYYLVGPGRYAEFEEIQARLRALPGVEVVEALGHEDVSFEIEGFTIEAEGRGRIAFGSLGLDSFEATDHLCLQAIGDYEILVRREGFLGVYHARTQEPMRSEGSGGGIGVGPRDPFARFFPFALSSVQGVLEHYDEICSELATWPVQPEYGTFQDEAGTDYFYSVKDPALGEDGIYPAELEPDPGR